MGFLGKKKQIDTHVSVLSEEEIQKKLYGEFKKDATRIAGGSEREHSANMIPVAPKQPATEESPDLFTQPKENQSEHPDFPATGREPEVFSEPLTKPKPVGPKHQPALSSQVADPYQRYRELNKPMAKKWDGFHKVIEAAGNAGDFVRELFESNRFYVRQILYWSGGVLVVFHPARDTG